MVKRYMGIENEFTSFRYVPNWIGEENRGYDERISFIYDFDRISEPEDFKKYETSIRTKEGLAYYVDGDELEMCTPPVAIRKGFASDLTDLLMIGRDRLVAKTPDLKHTGYSMHWNITRSRIWDSPNLFYYGVIVPFQMFGLNILSTGMNIRTKPGRIEILGDSIVDEKQIRAAALMLGAYTFAMEHSGFPPLEIGCSVNVESLKDNVLRFANRNIPISVRVNSNWGRKTKNSWLSAQEYLETFYNWIQPIVKELGTPEEIIDLENYVFGRKCLEIDKYESFKTMLANREYANGVFLPKGAVKAYSCSSPIQENDRVLVNTGKKRELPLEGRLLGSFLKINKNEQLFDLDWERAVVDDSFLGIMFPRAIRGISGIYRYAANQEGCLEELESKQSADFSDVAPAKCDVRIRSISDL